MLEEIRTELNDYTPDKTQGTTTGVFDNSDIVKKINKSQRYIFNILFTRFPDLFLTSQNVTGVSGVFTLPVDLYRICDIVNSYGDKVAPISIQTKHRTNYTGSKYLYYRQGNTIVRDDGGSDTLTFHYYKEPRELTQGVSQGGTATSITLALTAKKTADYYNGIVIENVSDDWYDTITDYTAARVATVTNRATLGRYYGTVSELPEVFHHLITKKAWLELKNTVVAPQRAGVPEIGDFKDDLVETLRGFTGTYGSDVTMSDLFYDFRPY